MRLILDAACDISVLPTAVDPVKDIFRTSGLVAISSPKPRLSFDVITLRTPLGTPASSASLANAMAEKGVCEAGLSTTEHPAARAGATLRVIIANVKCHGCIAATTPTH